MTVGNTGGRSKPQPMLLTAGKTVTSLGSIHFLTDCVRVANQGNLGRRTTFVDKERNMDIKSVNHSSIVLNVIHSQR